MEAIFPPHTWIIQIIAVLFNTHKTTQAINNLEVPHFSCIVICLLTAEVAAATHTLVTATPQQYPQQYPQYPVPPQSYQRVPYQPVPGHPGYPAMPGNQAVLMTIPLSHEQPFTPPPSYQDASECGFEHYLSIYRSIDRSKIYFLMIYYYSKQSVCWMLQGLHRVLAEMHCTPTLSKWCQRSAELFCIFCSSE